MSPALRAGFLQEGIPETLRAVLAFPGKWLFDTEILVHTSLVRGRSHEDIRGLHRLMCIEISREETKGQGEKNRESWGVFF